MVVSISRYSPFSLCISLSEIQAILMIHFWTMGTSLLTWSNISLVQCKSSERVSGILMSTQENTRGLVMDNLDFVHEVDSLFFFYLLLCELDKFEEIFPSTRGAITHEEVRMQVTPVGSSVMITFESDCFDK